MSTLSDYYDSETRAAGRDRAGQRRNFDDDRNRFLDMLGGGQEAFETSARAAVAAAMPAFNQSMQNVNESAQRRGISNGETAGFYANTQASNFQSNIANALAGQAMNLYGTQLGASGDLMGQSAGLMESGSNRFLDMLGGGVERDEAAKARHKAAKGAIWGGVGQLAGMGLGGWAGGGFKGL